MPRASSASLPAIVVMLLGAGLAAAQTANPNRIAQKVEANQMELVLGTVHPLAQAEFDQGPVAGSMPLAHVAIVFRLSDAQQEALDQLLAEQQDPSSPNYRKWLTPEQYADRFGLTPGDTAKVVSWLKSQGLTVESVSRSRTEIFFAGSAAQISSALRTEIHRFSMSGKNHFANVTEPSVPSAFAYMVLGFRNLDDFRPKSRMRVLPRFTSNQSGKHFLAPDDFATIYDLQSLYTAGLDGTGVSIGVVGDSAITLGDIEAFRAAAGLPVNDPTVVPVTGETPIHNGDDEVEADLDIEWSGGVAKNASIIYYVAGTSGGNSPNAFDALQFAIDDDATRVISNSFGNCEANLGSNNATIIRGWITQAVSQGQTVTTASGDTGASDCETQSATVATLGLGVDLPAAVPEITAVGGSEFTGDPSSLTDTQYWSAANNSHNGSAKSYIPEITWNDGPSPGIGPFTTLAAGGGGASTFFTKAQAPWQNGVTPNDGKRDVPDVALNASPAHDGYLICSQVSYNENDPGVTSCTAGFRGSDQSLNPIGGTSAGAPTMAGIVAIMNQATKSCGLGNINGSSGGATGLYKLATSQPTAFHDILPPPASGNIVPCTKGTTGCPATAPFQYGFSTTTGYDQATGLGSVNADILTKNWPGYDPGQTLTTSAAVVSSSPTVNVDTNVMFTATVSTTAANCPGTASPALSIAGTVQFSSDGSNIGSGTVSNGVATLQTAALAVGAHQIVANYQGDANYLASTSPAITQTINAIPDYGFSAPAPPTLSLSPGASGTSTLTVTANSVGFTGTVNFTCAPSSLTAEIACSLSPSSVALSSGTTSGQTTLTVKTTAPTSASAAVPRSRGFNWMAASGAALFGGVLLIGTAPRRRSATLACLMLLTFLSAGLGCGGSSSSSNPGNPGTPAGLYNITVTATSTTTTSQGPSHTVTVTLTVP